MYISAAKQVGPISYLTSSKERLTQNINLCRIRTSRNTEMNDSLHKKMYYVSFSRDLTAAAKRNPDRWRYGLILDGDVLSNRYHISPYSFAGAGVNRGTSLRVKGIRAYTDGTCQLILVNWPTINIPKSSYEAIKEQMLNMAEDYKADKKFTIQGPGKFARNGMLRTEYLFYNVPSGGFALNQKYIPSEALSVILKHSSMNESEERIWFSEESFVDIRGAVVGIILPKEEYADFQQSYDASYADLRNAIEHVAGKDYRVLTY